MHNAETQLYRIFGSSSLQFLKKPLWISKNYPFKEWLETGKKTRFRYIDIFSISVSLSEYRYCFFPFSISIAVSVSYTVEYRFQTPV